MVCLGLKEKGFKQHFQEMANFSWVEQIYDVFVQVVSCGCAHAVAGVHGAGAAVDSRLDGADTSVFQNGYEIL